MEIRWPSWTGQGVKDAQGSHRQTIECRLRPESTDRQLGQTTSTSLVGNQTYGMAGLSRADGLRKLSRWCRMTSRGPGGMRASAKALQQASRRAASYVETMQSSCLRKSTSPPFVVAVLSHSHTIKQPYNLSIL